jgi:NAD(P)-dependent dehydrogenase (short-subunit alcohol dehydrogenase family)
MSGLVQDRSVVIYGAGGVIGSALAAAFAREGARLFLAGRHRAALEEVVARISPAGATTSVAEVDALDAAQVEAHAAAVAAEAGGIDVSVNVIGYGELQGVPLADMTPEDYTRPIADRTRANFLTATAAARRMVPRGSGVILLLTASASRAAGQGMGGFGVANAAVEAFTRGLAAEIGPHGVRAVCMRSNYIPETGRHGDGPVPEFLVNGTLLRRLPTLADVARTAVFMASDHAAATTGAVANLTCGAIVD